jgi:hypothetical protein
VGENGGWWGKEILRIFEKFRVRDPIPQTPSNPVYTPLYGLPRHKTTLETSNTTKSL